MKKKRENLRINVYFTFVLAAAAVISYNLFVLTYVKHHYYSRIAEAQSQNINNDLVRGNIYMGEYLVATNKNFPLAYIVPADLEQHIAKDTAEKISLILDVNQEKISEIIDSRSDNFRVISRRISNEQVDAIKSLKIKGLGITYETDRFYPGGQLTSNVVGFLGYSGGERSGQYGVESFYNDELSGKKWSSNDYTTDSRAVYLISKIFKKTGESAGENEKEKISKPADIILSIDWDVQKLAEDKLDFLMQKWKAVGGTIIIQDPNTGKILAMVDRPTFNPNNYSEYEPRSFLNRGVQEIFEPGSSFKPITMAMGLDVGAISAEMTFNDVGFREEAGYRIKNFSERIFGNVTISQILERSINTGAMHIQDLVGDDNFLNYLINFGFGQRTGIDLPGEVNGDISNLYSGRKINFLTASFGQGIAVTPIQLVNAYSAIANGGKLMRPYVVEKIIKEEGSEETTEPEIVAIPISEKTATKLKSMLVSVVDNGFDKARVSGYDVAGKTGTAQIADGMSISMILWGSLLPLIPSL